MSEPWLQDRPIIWGWAEDPCAENWRGPFSTKQEAIDDALASKDDDYDQPLQAFYVQEARYVSIAKCAGMVADSIREQLIEQMNEIDEVSFSEDACFEPKASEIAPTAFKYAIVDWASQYIECGNWQCVGTAERIERPTTSEPVEEA